MTSRTSLIISGSRAEVGSSKSMIFGSMARALAMATLCCCPPERPLGYLNACSGIPTLSSSSMALASASLFGILFTFIGASVMFSIMVRWGKRLNCWNTNPISERTYFRSDTVVSSSTVMPSILIVPPLWGWSRLRVLMNVDFPDPDGPRMTIISPFLTLMSTPFSAQKSPKFTLTPSVSIIISSLSSLMQLLLLLLLRAQGSSRPSSRP